MRGEFTLPAYCLFLLEIPIFVTNVQLNILFL